MMVEVAMASKWAACVVQGKRNSREKKDNPLNTKLRNT